MPNKPVVPPDVDTLFQMLRDPRELRWRKRISASLALEKMPLTEEQRIEFRDSLRNMLLNPEGTGKQMLIAGLRVLALIVPAVLIWAFPYWNDPYYRFSLMTLWMLTLMIFFSSFTLFPSLLMLRTNRDNRVRIAFIQTLERLNDPMSVDALALAACDVSTQVSNAAESALLAVLPTLTPDYYGQLTADTVPNLCRILEGRRPRYHSPLPPLMRALILALEKIGDARAIPTVQRLIKFGPKTAQEEAQRLLDILKERQERETQSEILLRAASAPATTPAELLRPATEASTTASEQLLRASTE